MSQTTSKPSELFKQKDNQNNYSHLGITHIEEKESESDAEAPNS